MKQNKVLVFWAFWLLMGLFAGCRGGESQVLLLLHTNDSHGGVLAVDSVGGMMQRATYIRGMREKYKDVLLVDAGDINVGQPVSNRTDAEPDIRSYNRMGYDAVAIGNHEFDKSLDVLRKQMRQARFPFLASNILLGDSLLGVEYLIKEYGGTKVGMFGLTTRSTSEVSVGASGLTFLDEPEVARRMVRLLREKGATVVIALTHIGLTEPTEGYVSSPLLARLVDSIDIIVDGHSHSYIEEPLKVNNTWIVTAAQSGRYVGVGEMTIRDGKLAAFSWKPVLMKGYADDSLTREIIQPYVKMAAADLNTVIGYAEAPFEVLEDNVCLARCKESALGGILADAMLWKVRDGLKLKADFALINAGGIRDRLPGGDLKKGDVYLVLPFRNTLEVLAMKGCDVRRVFDYQAGLQPGNGAFAQISENVRVVYNRAEKRVVSLTIDGCAVADSALYHMATCDFVAAGKDGYKQVIKPEFFRTTTSRMISDVFIDYTQMKGRISPRTDGRIAFER